MLLDALTPLSVTLTYAQAISTLGTVGSSSAGAPHSILRQPLSEQAAFVATERQAILDRVCRAGPVVSMLQWSSLVVGDWVNRSSW